MEIERGSVATATKRKKEALEGEIARLSENIPDFEALVAAKDDPALQPFLNRIRLRIEKIEDSIQVKDAVFGIDPTRLKADLHLLAFLKSLTAWDQAADAIPRFKAKLREHQKDLNAINKQQNA